MKKQIFLYLLTFTFLLSACDNKKSSDRTSNPSSSSDTPSVEEPKEEAGSEGLQYELQDVDGSDTYVVTGYEGTAYEVIIPSKHENRKVLRINSNAFSDNQSIQSIKINEGVRFIQTNAFINCPKLRNFYFPKSLTNIETAFYENVASIVLIYAAMNEASEDWTDFDSLSCHDIIYGYIGKNGTTNSKYDFALSTLNDHTFATITKYQGKKESITIPDRVDLSGEHYPVEALSGGFLYGNNDVTQVTLNDSLLSIGDYTFKDAHTIETITLNENLKTIGKYAFSNCYKLNYLVFPESVTTVKESVFSNCDSLKTLYVKREQVEENDPNWKSYLDNWLDDDKFVVYNYADIIGESDGFHYALIDDGEKSLIITKYTGEDSDVEIPDEIKVNNKNIPVSGIGSALFMNNSLVKSVTLPKDVKILGTANFLNCSNLSEVNVNKQKLFVPRKTFASCSKLNDFNGEITGASDYAFDGASLLKNINMSNGLDFIGVRAFANCRALTKIALGDSLTEISESAFENCNSLTNFKLKNKLTKIGASAFKSCHSLNEIIIPKSVTEIGRDAFADCPNLKIYLERDEKPDGFDIYWNSDCNPYVYNYQDKGIKDNLEYAITVVNNKSVAMITGYEGDGTSITIPEKIETYPVTLISASAFKNQDKIEEITLPESLIQIGEYAFCDCASLKEIIIPASVKEIKMHAFEKCTSLETLTLNEGIIVIDDYAFANCKALTTITLPEEFTSLTKIGAWAFYNCENLVSIHIPESVVSVGGWAFSGCSNLTITVEFCDGEVPEGYHPSWNQLNCPVVYKLKEDNSEETL